MKSMLFLCLLSLFFSPIGWSDSAPTPAEMEQIIKLVGKLSSETLTDAAICEVAESVMEKRKPICADITDSLCAKLWSAKNGGNLEVSDGKILKGKSPKSEILLATLYDNQALVDSLNKLPADLAKELANPILKLKFILSTEDGSRGWAKKYADVKRSIESAIDKVSDARIKKMYPDIYAKKESDYTADEKVKVKAQSYRIKDEILEAKYKEHPNWKRVERVHKQAIQDLKLAIESMKISPEDKSVMLEKVSSVKLSLPYMAPEKGRFTEECGTTEVNARYNPSINGFVVCSGFFNSFQSEDILYGTVAHEIGHAVDPMNLAYTKCEHQSSLVKALSPLDRSTGAPIACEAWSNIVKQYTKNKGEIIPQVEEKLDNLYSCLKSRKYLDEFTTEAVRKAVSDSVSDDLKAYADDNDFLSLAVQSYEKFGEKKYNPNYMRPDIWYKNSYWRPKIKREFSDVNSPEIFTQSLSCQSVNVGGKLVSYADATEAQKIEMFENALDETREVEQARKEDQALYCGKNCSALPGIAVSAGENFADWISIRALQYRLEKMPTEKKKQEASALFSADLCSAPSTYSSQPKLAEAEQRLTSKVHSQNRVRRVSIYNQKNAEIVGCAVNEIDQGYGSCEP